MELVVYLVLWLLAMLVRSLAPSGEPVPSPAQTVLRSAGRSISPTAHRRVFRLRVDGTLRLGIGLDAPRLPSMRVGRSNRIVLPSRRAGKARVARARYGSTSPTCPPRPNRA